MKILSLITFSEEAGYVAEGVRHFAGAIKTPRTFEENFTALDRQHRGIYAFIAFHPVADEFVTQYINDNALGDDAGPHILALFFVQPNAPRRPRELRSEDVQFGVSLSLEEHPAYKLARLFFPSNASPRLPGIIFFDRLSEPGPSIYLLLEGTDKAQIRLQCRKAFEAAAYCISNKRADKKTSRMDFDHFAARLVEADLPYRREGKKGLRAAAFIAIAWIKKNKGAIAAAIPKLVGLSTKPATGGASS
jgi:hypothetical protein